MRERCEPGAHLAPPGGVEAQAVLKLSRPKGRPAMRPLLLVIVVVLRLALEAGFAPSVAGAGSAAAADNPCLTSGAKDLMCPDLVMRRPFDLRLERYERRWVLRAANSLDNVGLGPAELVGSRRGRYTMRAHQRIHRRGSRRPAVFQTGARLTFKAIPGQYRYWKYAHAARFELWRLDDDGARGRLVRVGPKLAYCLRDLRATHLQLPRAPRRPVYPACSQDRRARRVRIGTSVGWSDVYPAGYYEQWIDVTRLRGCFAYAQVADPRNGIHELDERNNESAVTVRLPYRRGARGCPRDRGPSGRPPDPGYSRRWPSDAPPQGPYAMARP